jgi:ribose transport system permease protein
VKKVGFNRVVLFLVLIVMYGAFVLLSDTFLSYNRILSALNYAYFLGFLSLGVTFVIATGGIDFSIGPVMFCAALVGGELLVHDGKPLVLSLIATIVVGLIFGILNGILVAYLKLPSFITSMASMMIAKGVGSVFTKTQSISWPQGTQENGGFRKLIKLTILHTDGSLPTQIPTGLIFFVVIAVICAIVLNKTKIGRYILCIGSNREAVRLSGVNVKKWEMLAYVFCGTLAGIAAVAYVGAYTTVQPGLGDTFNNEAIAGCVMGGTSMSGGTASIGGTFIGVMIIALLQEGILAMGFQKDWQYVITGLIVLAAVYADVRSRKRKN